MTPITQEQLLVSGFTVVPNGVNEFLFPQPFQYNVRLFHNPNTEQQWAITCGGAPRTTTLYTLKLPNNMEELASFYKGMCDKELIV